MTSSAVRNQHVQPWWIWPPVAVAVVVPFLAATLVSLGLGFTVMTDCTNAYDCTQTGCAPCQSADMWLAVGTGTQAVLLITAILLAVFAALRRWDWRLVVFISLAISALSVATVFATTAVAHSSY
jgi:lysylphosphatidylglycerol synthetase-like protein (DUF2156 family)